MPSLASIWHLLAQRGINLDGVLDFVRICLKRNIRSDSLVRSNKQWHCREPVSAHDEFGSNPVISEGGTTIVLVYCCMVVVYCMPAITASYLIGSKILFNSPFGGVM